jgi:hypothetical protein
LNCDMKPWFYKHRFVSEATAGGVSAIHRRSQSRFRRNTRKNTVCRIYTYFESLRIPSVSVRIGASRLPGRTVRRCRRRIDAGHCWHAPDERCDQAPLLLHALSSLGLPDELPIVRHDLRRKLSLVEREQTPIEATRLDTGCISPFIPLKNTIFTFET